MLRLTGLILVFALGAGAAFGLVSCGDDENPELLPGDTAKQILDNLDRAEEALADGDCEAAEEAVDQIVGDIEDLDRPVSKELRRELKQGAILLGERIAEECTPETTAPPTTEEAPEPPPEETTTEETATDEGDDDGDEGDDEGDDEGSPAPPSSEEPPPAQDPPPTTPTTPTTPQDSGGVGPGRATG